ncbi:MAG: bile acid:sodium symporter [Myxococcales bacterium]|nr:bile acid:sodium symporter [Myxococcales bacterium]
MPTARGTAAKAAALAVNRWIAARSHWLLVSLVAANLAFPAAGLALKQVDLFRVPGTPWDYDFSTLALTAMMLSASVQCRVGDFGELARQSAAASLLLAYVLAPAWALAASTVALGAFGGESALELRLGLFFTSLMPIAMTSAMWVRVAAGNVALALGLIAITTLFSVAAVPAYVHLFPGLAEGPVSVPVGEIVRQLVLSVTLPLLAGLSLRRLFPAAAERALPALGLLGNLGLFAALSTNVASAASHIRSEPAVLVVACAGTVAANLGLFALSLACARHLRSRRPGLPHADAVALVLAGGMRSTGTAMVIGSAAFPMMPLVTIPAAIYSISQQLLAGLLSRALAPGTGLLRTRAGSSRAELEAYMHRARRARRPWALLVFRLVSRMEGAAASPEVLGAVQRRVRGYDFVSRLGGDELGVVLLQADERQAGEVAQRLRAVLGNALPGSRIGWAVQAGRKGCAPGWLVESASELAGRCRSRGPATQGLAALNTTVSRS